MAQTITLAETVRVIFFRVNNDLSGGCFLDFDLGISVILWNRLSGCNDGFSKDGPIALENLQ